MNIEKKYIIFVEGTDDKAFFEKLLEDVSDIQIFSVEGKDNFKTILKTASQDDNFKMIILRK